MGTVKYSGPVASFHCPTEATIRSLKVHFSPKQAGSGDPSPENVRAIEEWTGVEITHSKKNLFNGIIKVGRDMTGDGTLDGSNTWRTSEPILVKPNTSYTIMNGNALLKPYINFYDNNMNILHTYTTQSIILTSENAKYITLQMTRSAFESILKDVAVYETGENIKTNYEFGVLGKNKFNAYDWQTDESCIEIHDSGSLTVSTIAYIENHNSYDISSTKGTTRTLSFKTKTNSLTNENATVNLAVLSDNGTTVLTGRALNLVEKDYETEYIITIPPEGNTLKFRNWGWNGSLTLSDIQLELGSTATAYEPYDPNKTVYGGWVDLISGEVAATDICVTYTGEENGFDIYSSKVYARVPIPYPAKGSWVDPIFVSHYLSNRTTGFPSISGGNTPNICFWFVTNSEKLVTDIFPTVQDMKDYFAQQYANETPIQVCYELATPITYHLPPTSMQTFLSHNNIWSNADYIEVEYDLHETQNILACKQFIIANQPHVEKLAAAPLQNFNIDMEAPLKECKVYFEPKQDLNGYTKPWVGGAGKNQLDINAVEYGTYDQETGLPVTSTYQYQVRTTYDILVNAGDSWISSNNVAHNCRCFFWDINDNYIGQLLVKPNIAFTIPNNATKMRLISGADPFIESEKWQLEKGSTATSYEPYENICPIEGWNTINLYKSGKNLLCLPVMTRTVNGITWTVNENGSIQVDGTASGDTWMSYWRNDSQHVDFYLKAGTYVLSRNGTPPVAVIYLVARDGSTTKDIGQVNKTMNSTTFTLEQDTLVGFQAAVTSNLGEIHTIIHPQLELLSLTDYEVPNNSVIPITFPSEAGTIYGGYVDLVKGKVVQTHKSVILNGNETWYNYANKHQLHFMTVFNDKKIGIGTSICDIYPNVKNDYFWDKDNLYAQYGDHPKLHNIYFNAPYQMPGLVNEWKAYLADHPMHLVYELETPIEYSIDPITLKTLRGTNNIWSNSNGDITVQFWKH